MDQNQDEPKSLLTSLRQHHVVHVHNPLSDPFTWQVARSVTGLTDRDRDPFIEKLNMRNDAHPTMQHVTQRITIAAGASMKLPGDVAQVYVKHLVDEIMQRSGDKLQMTNPTKRLEYEEKVVKNVNDLRQRVSTQSIQEQLDQQLADLNKDSEGAAIEPDEEEAFPGLRAPTGQADARTGDKQPDRQKAQAAK